MISLHPILLFLLPFGAALVAAIAGWWIRGAARWAALAGLAATAALSVIAAHATFLHGSLHTHLGGWAPPIGIELVLDPLSALMAVLVAWTALGVVAGTRRVTTHDVPGSETSFYATVMLLVAGLLGIVVTGDLFNLFVQLEVASLSAYALVGAGRRGAAKAAFNYLIIGTLGASLYLTGVGFLYAATGTLNMADLAGRLTEGPLALSGAVFIAAGLAVKMALFPLHGWMPSAYATSPATAASLMAPLVTKVAAYALLRILFWVYGVAHLADMAILMEVIAWAGAVAVIAGGVLAFVQRDLWRMFAYSSVSQTGIIALGIGLAGAAGLTGALLHLAADVLMKAALFLAAGAALARFGVRTVDRLGSLRGRAPWTTGILAITGISLIGLPPLAGFYGKWYVLLEAFEQGRWIFVAALVVGTLVTAAYVFRILEPLMFGKAPEHPDHAGVTEGPSPMIAAAAVFTVAIVLLGIYNEPVVRLLLLPALPLLSAGG